jgi:phospholipid/cholesterol/gamma-HCH transport system permease protein
MTSSRVADASHKPEGAGVDLRFDRPDSEVLIVRLIGSWKRGAQYPSPSTLGEQIESDQQIRRVGFDSSELVGWDTGFLTFLVNVLDLCRSLKVTVAQDGLPEGVQRLLRLAAAVPEAKDARPPSEHRPILIRIGDGAIAAKEQAREMLAFVGDATVAFLKMLTGRARYRGSDLKLTIQECGADALPIVSLISFLVGLILAFVGAVQLKMFGAEIYVADLVGIAMAREMGAMMTAIVLAGRTGAAFAAQLGTMTVNEEIDAFKTLGFPPMEFLVLPRMLALALMMPLLCLYADLVGILGGIVVGVGMLDLTITQYLNETREALSLTDFSVGLIKSVVFGILVALSGCLRGMQSGRSASAVGVAATSAVVTAIVAIIVTDAIFAVVTNILGV